MPSYFILLPGKDPSVPVVCHILKTQSFTVVPFGRLNLSGVLGELPPPIFFLSMAGGLCMARGEIKEPHCSPAKQNCLTEQEHPSSMTQRWTHNKIRPALHPDFSGSLALLMSSGSVCYDLHTHTHRHASTHTSPWSLYSAGWVVDRAASRTPTLPPARDCVEKQPMKDRERCLRRSPTMFCRVRKRSHNIHKVAWRSDIVCGQFKVLLSHCKLWEDRCTLSPGPELRS